MAPSVKFHPDDVDSMFDRKKEFYWDSLNYMEVMYFTYAMPGLPNKKKGCFIFKNLITNVFWCNYSMLKATSKVPLSI